MASVATHLSKSTILAGGQCPKRLWLSRHGRDRAAPLSDGVRAILEMGSEIGRLARELFPGGVLVDAGPREHAEAVLATQRLMSDPATTAIFEAAFEHSDVRVRVDVLERLGGDDWGLREVKAASRPKEIYVEDVAIQCWVLAGVGVRLRSAELIHVNAAYEYESDEIDWNRFFSRVEMFEAVGAFSESLPAQVDEFLGVVAADEPPEIEPSLHCRARRPCEFWEHCTRDRAEDWILRLPRITRRQFENLKAAGITRVSEIPGEFGLQRPQRHMREAVCSGVPFVEHGLAEMLAGSGPPASYLDFETANPPVPLYPKTRPFQNIPFQWSLHRDAGDDRLIHHEFLADGTGDPRRAFTESLLAVAGDHDDPILVYSPFESRVLENLAATFTDLRGEIGAVRARLVDLLPIVRDCVYHVDFRGSFSIKQVAPALAPGFGYGDLDGVAEGGAAAAAWREIASSAPGDERATSLRRQLLAYCARDTLALVEVHRALRERI
jgi:predicted RecB family nuclease